MTYFIIITSFVSKKMDLSKDIQQERHLLMLISEGDEGAFGQVFNYYFDHLYGFTLSVTKSAVLTEEILQDVFVKVWQKRAVLPSIEKFEAWLFILTRNHAYKVVQRELARPSYHEYLVSYFSQSADSPEQRLYYKEFQEALSHAVASLPKQQRLVFTRSRLQGCSLDEISAELHLSKYTVKSHLTKAIHAVRRYLQQCSYSLPIVLLIWHFITRG